MASSKGSIIASIIDKIIVTKKARYTYVFMPSIGLRIICVVSVTTQSSNNFFINVETNVTLILNVVGGNKGSKYHQLRKFK